MYPVVVIRIGTASKKGCSWRFCVDSRVSHESPEEGQRISRPKRCDYCKKDEVNISNVHSNCKAFFL